MKVGWLGVEAMTSLL